MSGNNTILHLPNGDSEVLHEEHLDDEAKRPRLLALMLAPGNFGRAFPILKSRAQEFGIDPNYFRA